MILNCSFENISFLFGFVVGATYIIIHNFKLERHASAYELAMSWQPTEEMQLEFDIQMKYKFLASQKFVSQIVFKY